VLKLWLMAENNPHEAQKSILRRHTILIRNIIQENGQLLKCIWRALDAKDKFKRKCVGESGFILKRIEITLGKTQPRSA